MLLTTYMYYRRFDCQCFFEPVLINKSGHNLGRSKEGKRRYLITMTAEARKKNILRAFTNSMKLIAVKYTFVSRSL